jgi:hypothetical protein
MYREMQWTIEYVQNRHATRYSRKAYTMTTTCSGVLSRSHKVKVTSCIFTSGIKYHGINRQILDPGTAIGPFSTLREKVRWFEKDWSKCICTFPFCVTSVRATSTMVLSQLPYQKLCLQFRNLLFAFCTETRIVFADVRQNVCFVITSAKSVILYDI